MEWFAPGLLCYVAMAFVYAQWVLRQDDARLDRFRSSQGAAMLVAVCLLLWWLLALMDVAFLLMRGWVFVSLRLFARICWCCQGRGHVVDVPGCTLKCGACRGHGVTLTAAGRLWAALGLPLGFMKELAD